MLTELRLLVGYLGEQEPGWWASNFFAETATAFLQPVFGRSTQQAQYQGVLEAARRIHDEHIGVGRSLHLFHLPEAYEQSAARLVADRERCGELFSHTQSAEQALSRLETLATHQQSEEGPVLVGESGVDLDVHLSAMAGLYLDAFRRGIQTFPYLREV